MSPDIALCRNKKCPARGNCYRFLAKADCHLVYTLFRVEEGKDRCEYYIPSQLDLPLTNRA
jgi:hypothetical protein